MPSHAFWVIVAGTTPTAFRARERETLLPTLKQLQRTQPDVHLRWFDRGKLWDSPIAAREALYAQRKMRSDRKPGWRPGGNHADPRERYKLTRDQKRARFKRKQRGDGPGPPSRSPRLGEPGKRGDAEAGKTGSQKPNWKAARRKPWRSTGQRAGKFGVRSRPGRGRGPRRGGHGGSG